LEPDLILITETWCNAEITDAYLNLPGYEVQQDLRRDRTDTRDGRGGGILVYNKIGLKVLASDNSTDFNQYCKFEVNDTTFYVVYRPPNGSQKNMESLAELIRKSEKNVIFVGDFNLQVWIGRRGRPGRGKRSCWRPPRTG
jgi:hypothetical protein